MSAILIPGSARDADAIGRLHAESWQASYRGIMPDRFLDIEALEDRQSAWRSRLAVETDRRWLLKAHDEDSELVGFACVELDAEPEWGALLDNLHVRPDRKGRGIGRRLFDAAREWSFEQLGHQGLHLWVIEANLEGQQFYNRIGGTIAERKIKDVVGVVKLPALRYVWK
jgi:GNAT superfamily N-acetyltransferase